MRDPGARRLRRALSELGLGYWGIIVPTFASGSELIPAAEDREILVERLVKAVDLVNFLRGRPLCAA